MLSNATIGTEMPNSRRLLVLQEPTGSINAGREGIKQLVSHDTVSPSNGILPSRPVQGNSLAGVLSTHPAGQTSTSGIPGRQSVSWVPRRHSTLHYPAAPRVSPGPQSPGSPAFLTLCSEGHSRLAFSGSESLDTGLTTLK